MQYFADSAIVSLDFREGERERKKKKSELKWRKSVRKKNVV